MMADMTQDYLDFLNELAELIDKFLKPFRPLIDFVEIMRGVNNGED
ncbi:MAG: hypothetical protein ACTSP6_06070 [Promethearchaeota archaeon]